MHLFVVLGVALVLAGLMGLEQEPQQADRHLRWIQFGLLISLLSKPLVATMLPVLFVLPETRRKLLLPVAVYAAPVVPVPVGAAAQSRRLQRHPLVAHPQRGVQGQVVRRC